MKKFDETKNFFKIIVIKDCYFLKNMVQIIL